MATVLRRAHELATVPAAVVRVRRGESNRRGGRHDHALIPGAPRLENGHWGA